MYGNPLNPFNPYWWTGGPSPAIPARQRSCLKQLCIFELPTTNVALSETSVDYGIDKCLYNQLPCECYVTVQVNQAIKNLIKDLPHCEFEDLRFKLLDEIIDLRRLKENRLP